MSALNLRIEQMRAWVRQHPWRTATVLFALFGIWFAFKGVDLYAQNKDERDIITARDAATAAVAARSNALINLMVQAQKKVEPVTAYTGEVFIMQIFKDSFKEAEVVEVHAPGLAAAYDDVAGFGAGRLALLEAATNDPQVAVRIIKAGGGHHLDRTGEQRFGVGRILYFVGRPTTAWFECLRARTAGLDARVFPAQIRRQRHEPAQARYRFSHRARRCCQLGGFE